MKLHQLDSLSKEGKYTIITAPAPFWCLKAPKRGSGSGKTKEIVLLYLRRLAESQKQSNKQSNNQTIKQLVATNS